MTRQTRREFEQELIELRLEEVKTLRSKELTLREIAQKLNVSPGTIWSDLNTLNKRAKSNIAKTIERDLPMEFDLTLAGLKAIIKREWQIADISPDNREVTAALALVKECMMLSMAMRTQAQLVDRAINVVRIHKKRRRVIDEEITDYTTSPIPSEQSKLSAIENVD